MVGTNQSTTKEMLQSLSKNDGEFWLLVRSNEEMIRCRNSPKAEPLNSPKQSHQAQDRVSL